MRIVQDLPPMIDEIDAAFHVRGKPVIFCWGSTIYNPVGIHVTPALIAHERVHCGQQGNDIEGWWKRYIDDPAFRLDQEAEAHRAEYEFMARNGARHDRRRAKKIVAKRLASPLYGKVTTLKAAERMISGAMAS